MLVQEPLALDSAVIRKISKRRFFQDIINSFQGATQLGLKPPQFFCFKKSQQKQSLEAFKFWADMGCSKQAD